MKLNRLLHQVALDRSVSVDDMRSASRFKDVVEARREFFYRARTETGYSSPVIGRVCNKDHSTVLVGAAKFKNCITEPSEFSSISERSS